MKNSVRMQREAHTISRESLALSVGVDLRTICCIEDGRADPSLVLAYRIARVLDLHVEEVFELEDQPLSHDDLLPKGRRELEKMISEEYDQCS
jgi:putative transcriptional regulator